MRERHMAFAAFFPFALTSGTAAFVYVLAEHKRPKSNKGTKRDIGFRPDERFAAGTMPVVFSTNMDLFEGGNTNEQNSLRWS